MTDPSFWRSVLRSAEAEPREETGVRGASGIQYSAIALGVDESRRRLLVVSAEHDARTAAMAQVDIQSALDRYQVLVARPVAFDLPALAKTIMLLTGRTVFTLDELRRLDTKSEDFSTVLKNNFGKIFAPLDFIARIPLNTVSQWMHLVQQLALVQFDLCDSQTYPGTKTASLDLGALTALDALERDNHFGICPIPLYDFAESEIEVLNSGANLDAVREVLKSHSLLQYFFPAPDLLALGLVDRGSTSTKEVLAQLLMTPEIGHPYGDMEVVGNNVAIPDIIEMLQDRGLLVEGELGMEVGPTGKSIRQTVRFKPREGFISKLISRFSFKVDLKNVIGLK
jgi:hypothetical protein